jgi:hypothetical protein
LYKYIVLFAHESFWKICKGNTSAQGVTNNQDHPVIDQLVRIRTVLERLKPLDKKLSYQINKLLTLAATGNIYGNVTK